ncbi:hypothetical protein Syun_018730 [Stephania yunnanensis]|uniref:Uncharacterized protein n=1 Tax=Stephania yunnanensis TaxID=152371 RepID=A0AAP0IUC4_9MAGN
MVFEALTKSIPWQRRRSANDGGAAQPVAIDAISRCDEERLTAVGAARPLTAEGQGRRPWFPTQRRTAATNGGAAQEGMAVGTTFGRCDVHSQRWQRPQLRQTKSISGFGRQISRIERLGVDGESV